MEKMPDPNSVQKTMRWVIIAFLAYALWHTAYTPKPQPPKQPLQGQAQQQAVAQAVKDEDCNKKHFPIFSVPLIPTFSVNQVAQDVTKGTGPIAICGQSADIRYEYIDYNKKTLEKGSRTIAIGDGQLLHGAELGMLGMQAGGRRKISFPPPLAFTHDPDVKFREDISNHSVLADITLIRLSPDVPSSPMPLRAIASQIGDGKVASCGDTVNANITLWKTDGTQLFSAPSPIAFTIGKSQVPYGIEQGLLGAKENGEQIIIIPPAYNKPLISSTNNPDLLPALPDNAIIIAQIEVLRIGPAAAKDVVPSVELDTAPAEHNDDKPKNNDDKK